MYVALRYNRSVTEADSGPVTGGFEMTREVNSRFSTTTFNIDVVTVTGRSEGRTSHNTAHRLIYRLQGTNL